MALTSTTCNGGTAGQRPLRDLGELGHAPCRFQELPGQVRFVHQDDGIERQQPGFPRCRLADVPYPRNSRRLPHMSGVAHSTAHAAG